MDRNYFFNRADFLDFDYIYTDLQSMSRAKKTRTPNNRFKSFTFKLSLRQYNSLKNFSEIEGTTPLKVVKERIYDCIEEYSDEQLGKEAIAKNQLSLFKIIPPEEQQLDMFDE